MPARCRRKEGASEACATAPNRRRGQRTRPRADEKKPYVNDPDGNTINLCRGQPPQGAASPTLAPTNRRVTVCVHNIVRRVRGHRLRPDWLEAFFQHYSALGAEHFFIYVRRVLDLTPAPPALGCGASTRWAVAYHASVCLAHQSCCASRFF